MQLIRKVSLSTLILFFIISCRGKEPCALGSGGIYMFPAVPKNSSMTKDEVDEFLDLPEDVSKCISTESLIETCLAYPQLGLIDAGSSPQNGYSLVSSIFRGLRELSARSNKSEFLLKKYKSIDPLGYNPAGDLLTIGKYIQQLSYLEIIISQDNNLNSFNSAQKVELVEMARTVYESKKKDLTNYGLFRLATTASVLARLMKADQYKPFLEVYKTTDRNWDVVNFYWSTDYPTVEIIYSLSKDYLVTLKQGK